MELLVTAPVRLEFSLNSSLKAYKSEMFYKFWKDIKLKEYKDEKFTSITYSNSTINKDDGEEAYDHYSKTDQEILEIDILNLSNSILSNEKKDKTSFSSIFFDSITKSTINVYDNTIGILDIRLRVNNTEGKEADFTVYCEDSIKSIIKKIFDSLLISINKFFKFLKQHDSYNIIQKLNSNNEYNDFVDLYRENKNLKIMWASCAIRYEKGDENKLDLIDYWLEKAVDKQRIKEVKDNDTSCSLEWLKYVFRENCKDYEEQWKVMFLAQYYYSVIDVIIYNLKLIINESYQTNNEVKSLSSLFEKNRIVLVNQKLESISEASYMHIVEHKDVKKYLNRNKLALFNNILDAWTFDDLIENTQDLLSTVKDRVDLIYNKISTRNNFYTDILLTFIGFFAIIDLVLNFSQYSREYTADAMISSRHSDENSMLNYLSTIPIDTFIGSGFFISISLLVVYFIYRKRILP
jgi:hypothetical protein